LHFSINHNKNIITNEQKKRTNKQTNKQALVITTTPRIGNSNNNTECRVYGAAIMAKPPGSRDEGRLEQNQAYSASV